MSPRFDGVIVAWTQKVQARKESQSIFSNESMIGDRSSSVST